MNAAILRTKYDGVRRRLWDVQPAPQVRGVVKPPSYPWSHSDMAPSRPTVPLIMQAVAQAFCVSVEDIKGPRRQIGLIAARQAVMFLSREMTKLSLPQIGRAIGDRDHTTVLHGVRACAQRICKDEDVASMLNHARQIVRGMIRPVPVVSDTAVLHYLEHVLGIDATDVRRHLSVMTEGAVAGQLSATKVDGHWVVLDGCRVVDVLPKGKVANRRVVYQAREEAAQ